MNMSLRPFLIGIGILFCISSCSLAQAATYYVSPTGSDTNPGTISQPFATLQEAHDIANPGDTIYMRGGTYQFSLGQALSRDGTSGNPIKVFAYPGEQPVIDAINMTQLGYVAGFPISLNNASWWHIKGIEIKNGPSGGLVVYNASSNNIIENNNVHHNGRLDAFDGKGIVAIGTGANNLFLNNDSHHNRDQSSDGGNADGFQIALTGSGNVLRGNRAWRNSDDGFDFFNILDNTTAGALLIENNWSWENGYNDNLQPLGNGMGFKLGGKRSGTSGSSGGHTVQNNLSWKNKGHGFDENGATVPMILNNNTGWSNAGDNYLFQNTVSTFHNNIDYINGQGRHINASSNVTHNSWTLPVTVTNADFVSLDYSGAAGPRNADGSLPTINFLRLAAGSDLIDKGTNVGIAYTGSAPDLGAYEYTNTNLVASPPAPSNLVVK
jgi:hypothetical protein